MQADRALQYLRQRPYIWIPVTSDETVAALRELRKAGHDIRTRFTDGVREACYTPPAPSKQLTMAQVAEQVFQDDIKQQIADRTGAAVFDVVSAAAGDDPWTNPQKPPPCTHPEDARQARTDAVGTVCVECGETFTTVGASTPGEAGRVNALRAVKVGKDDYRYEVSAQTCPQCGEEYLVRDEHVQKSARHKAWARGELAGPEVPVPQQQPTFKFPLDMPRSRIEFGLVITCPRCHGKRLGERFGKGKQSGVKLPAEDFTRDPSRKDERCMRCNGWGIVPNQGPVVTDSQLTKERDYG